MPRPARNIRPSRRRGPGSASPRSAPPPTAPRTASRPPTRPGWPARRWRGWKARSTRGRGLPRRAGPRSAAQRSTAAGPRARSRRSWRSGPRRGSGAGGPAVRTRACGRRPGTIPEASRRWRHRPSAARRRSPTSAARAPRSYTSSRGGPTAAPPRRCRWARPPCRTCPTPCARADRPAGARERPRSRPGLAPGASAHPAEPMAAEELQGLEDGPAHVHLALARLAVVAEDQRRLGDHGAEPVQLQEDVHHAGEAGLADEILPPAREGLAQEARPVGAVAARVIPYPGDRIDEPEERARAAAQHAPATGHAEDAAAGRVARSHDHVVALLDQHGHARDEAGALGVI